MSTKTIEQPTLLERFVTLIPGPYPFAAFVWAALIPSGLLFDATSLITTGGSPFSLSTLPNILLNLLFVFYAFLMVRYMRLRVVGAEAHIAPRLAGGSDEYHKSFGRLTQTLPVLVITAFLGTLLLSSNLSRVTQSAWLIAANSLVTYLATFAGVTYLWEFAAVSWGLNKLGGKSLNLGSFLEDRMMGTHPLGNLSLSLTVAYFGEILIAMLLFSTFITFDVGTIVVFTGFLLLGVGLFFLPLNSIHSRMQYEKRRLLREIGARYPRLKQELPQPGPSVTLDDLDAKLGKMNDLQEVEMLDRKIMALPTWPFDVQVVSKFIAIVVSVTAVLLTRLITDYLIHI